MRRLIVVAVGLAALTAFTAMPAGQVMAQVAAPSPRPSPAAPDCLGEYLTCLGGAFQDLYCCATPMQHNANPRRSHRRRLNQPQICWGRRTVSNYSTMTCTAATMTSWRA